jgi:hypothetical protein
MEDFSSGSFVLASLIISVISLTLACMTFGMMLMGNNHRYSEEDRRKDDLRRTIRETGDDESKRTTKK